MTLSAPTVSLRQASFIDFCPITEAVSALANAGTEERGAIFTKREVVDFLLDLTGYTIDRPLHTFRLMEPSFGGGDFLIPAIDRLLDAWRTAKVPDANAVESLSGAIRAVELHRASFDATRTKVITALQGAGISPHDAQALADTWLIHGDYLLADIEEPFDVVIGNPPYVRQELIPDVLLTEYRSRYETVYDRAD